MCCNGFETVVWYSRFETAVCSNRFETVMCRAYRPALGAQIIHVQRDLLPREPAAARQNQNRHVSLQQLNVIEYVFAIYRLKSSFYQDRLGTNVGKTQFDH